jgi:signal transduction histidine kinase
VTLKTRLAAMMIVLLVAVMAAQWMLTQREQAVLLERLEAITREIDETTRGFSEMSLEVFADADSLHASGASGGAALAGMERILADVEREDSSAVKVMIVVDQDSSRFEYHGEDAVAWQEKLKEEDSPVLRRFLERHGNFRIVRQDVSGSRVLLATEAESLDVDLRRWQQSAPGDTTVQLFFTGTGPLPEPGEEHLVKVHLPLPGPRGPGSVELLYPVAGLTEELAHAKRRSWTWMACLLGVGATGAVLLAVQFTRPIRSLETSFGRVVSGDLDVRVSPQRRDEIGRLTSSFNEMVSSLREKRSMEERLSEAERLAAVGQLAAGVAHEVRNPLNAMRLTMGQLGDKTAPPPGTPERERFDHYTGLVTAELERLERMVGTFLDLSRGDDPIRESVDVGRQLRDCVALFEPEAQSRGVALEVEAPEPLPVRGDPARLPTVWNNLVANALAAVEPGGRVRVTARADGDDVRVEVADDGRGIAPERIGRIWEPFYTDRAEGSGLGLSLVRAIVERHGGEVSAESEPGRGATFRVRLPAADATRVHRADDAGAPA